MRPFDPRLLRAVPESRRGVGALAALGVIAGSLAIAQAFAVTSLVVSVVGGMPVQASLLAVVAVFTGRAVVSAATERVAARAGARVSTALRERLLAGWLTRSADARPEPAQALTLATTGATTVEPYVARYLPALVAGVVLPILAVGTLLLVDWVSALVVVVTVPLLPLFAALIGRATEEATSRRWKTSASLAGHFLDVVQGLPTLVGYGRARRQARTIEEVSQRHRRATVETLRIAFLSSAALELLATLSVAVVAVSVGIRLANGSMALHTGLVAILISPEAYWPIRRVGAEFHNAADGAAAADQILAELASASAQATEPATGRASAQATEPATGRASAQATAQARGQASEQMARVEHLTYTYPGAERPTLTDLTEDFRQGLTVVTGPSGAGKSTLLELLAGLRSPTSGTATAPHAHLVTQTPFLTAGTIRENLSLGARRHSDAELWAALDAADMGAVITALDTQLDTQLGDAGFGLSAGQRARLALARALLSQAPMLLLDEPTAHLDGESVARVHTLVSELARNRVVVAVSHRAELVALADHVVTVHPAPAQATR